VILHPTNFSADANHALQLATDLARTYQARLVILHVADTLGPEKLTYGEAESGLDPDRYRRQLADELRELVPAPAGVAVEYLLAEDEAAEEIVRVARERGCDLIVMGTHGRTGLDRVLMGSVAEQVIRTAPCPVLVTRSQGPAATGAR
jgi:nucleotide-binding universal stress UspA family protein